MIEALRGETVTTGTKIWLGRALAYHAMFCYRSGEYLRGRAIIDESITILRSLEIPQLLIEPLIYSTIIYGLTGDITAAQVNVDEGVALARQFNDGWFLAVGIFNQGSLCRLRGELHRADQLFKEALALWRAMGNPARLTGLALHYLSVIAIQLDVRTEARQYLEESLKLASSITDRWGVGTALMGFGILELREGNTVAAERYIRQSIAIFTELGARGDLAESLTTLGKVHLYCSEYEDAQKVLEEAIRLGLESNTMPQVNEATVELADCLLQLGDRQRAARLSMSVLEKEQVAERVRRKAEQVTAGALGQDSAVDKNETT